MNPLVVLVTVILCAISLSIPTTAAAGAGNGSQRERVIHTKGAPDSVVWVVQFSDLHFSVHHPDRAIDFHDLVGPALSFINPSLVLITGDLTGVCVLSMNTVYYASQVSIFHVLMCDYVVFTMWGVNMFC